jgi:predicted DNA-binding antitoxin AbrB/MazE fold protein
VATTPRIKEEAKIMTEVINAIYENGVFRPLRRPDVSDGQQVRLIVEAFPESSVDDLLELAAQVYNGLSDKEIDEIEQIALNRRDFFRNRIL